MKLFHGTKVLVMAAILAIEPVESVHSQDLSFTQARSYLDITLSVLAAVGVTYATYRVCSAMSAWIASWYQTPDQPREVDVEIIIASSSVYRRGRVHVYRRAYGSGFAYGEYGGSNYHFSHEPVVYQANDGYTYRIRAGLYNRVVPRSHGAIEERTFQLKNRRLHSLQNPLQNPLQHRRHFA